ncbi:hypothetical protein OO009_12750 [Flavobacteriaceae bacterium KMM 6897]|nr:hypothetical protein [Flavobacteriaceae bacterium KMM 6897]
MNKPYLRAKIYFLFFCLLILISSCNGQNKVNKQNNNHIEPNTIGTKYALVTKTQPTKNALAENVHCSLLDKAGNLWFGTTGHGVFKYDGESFTNYTVKDGLGGNRVIDICEDEKGNILFGTDKGVYYYDGKSIKEFLNNEGLGEQSISELFVDSKGQIWIGTHHTGMYVYNGKSVNNLLSNDSIINDFGLTLNAINDITEDKTGNIWFASWAIASEGVIRYDGKTLLRQTKKQGIIDTKFHSVIEDKSGAIWAGSRDFGLLRYNGNSFTQILENNGPGNESILWILEDTNGNIWFTSGSKGVYRYDGNSFKNYTTEDGLIHNSVFTIVEGNDGNLWFGTRNVGLSRFDGESFKDFSE